MFNSIIWLATLVVVYFSFLIFTPKKAPAPIVLKPYVEETKVAASTEAAPAAAPVAETVAYEQNPVDIEKGKEIYLSQCIKCHNKDPNVKGAIGPEMVDAPLEVMQAKVFTGRYPEVLPEGFVPKRKTKQMTKLPQYIKDVPSIHAYVQSLKK